MRRLSAPRSEYDVAMTRDTRNLPRWLDGLVIYGAAAAMVAWTWRTWTDPLVDFGRELYVPWQINLGQRLYGDIAYFNGPLSPYLNALFMHVFGVSLTTLLAANMAITAAILALLYWLLDAAADRLTAVVACLFFVAVFGFGRVVAIAGFNYLSPYSHEMTHGIALSLAALACLYLPRRFGVGNVVAAGALAGLTFLTKVEVAFACIVAVCVGFALRVAVEQPARRWKLTLMLCGACLAPVVLAFGLLWSQVSAAQALESTLGSLYWTIHSNVASSGLYRLGMGLDHLPANLETMGIASVLLSAGALLAVGAGWLAMRVNANKESSVPAVLAFLAAAGLLLPTIHSIHWFNTLPKALPLAMILCVAVWAVKYVRNGRSPESARLLGLRLTLSVFALMMLAKIFFNTRLYHYGFALAMPAMLLLLAVFLSWGPKSRPLRSADGSVVRAAALGLTVVMVAAYLLPMSIRLRDQHYVVGSGSDYFWADGRGNAEEATLKWIQQNTRPGSTVMVLPEGVMINYLSRRQNPTKYVNFMPPEVIMFGEDRIIKDFSAHPPDYIILVHKDTSEYGRPFFAHDYGQKIAAWVRTNYDGVALLGDPPFIDVNHFGIVILRRRPAAEMLGNVSR